MFDLDSLSIDELISLKNTLSMFSVDEINTAINLTISRKRKLRSKESLNIKFDLDCMEKCHIFNKQEIAFLKKNGINNFQELLDFDLYDIYGVSSSLIGKIEEVKKYYDLSNYSDIINDSKIR